MPIRADVELTCGVPSLSIRGTRWRGAYFASSRFILTSRRSPSVRHTNTNSCGRISKEKCFSDHPKLQTVSNVICTRLLFNSPLPNLLYTFDVDSGKNVLEGSGVKQVTHFLLGLRFKHNTDKQLILIQEVARCYSLRMPWQSMQTAMRRLFAELLNLSVLKTYLWMPNTSSEPQVCADRLVNTMSGLGRVGR